MLLHRIIFSYLAMEPDSVETGAGTSSPTTTISCLPLELLSHVFSFLDAPAPSDLRLHDQPHADMLRARDPPSQPLKSVSLVSHRWRAAVLPLLFRHAVWYFDRFDLMQVDHLKDSPAAAFDAIPLLPFVRDHNLASYIRTLTLVVKSTRTTGAGSGSGDRDVGLYRRGDGSGHYGYMPEPLSPSPRRVRASERDLIFNEDSNWLWNLLFDALSPLRFTLIASPRMLAFLLARMLFLGDEWSFNMSHHILSLSRDDPKRTKPVTDKQDQKKPATSPSSAQEEGSEQKAFFSPSPASPSPSPPSSSSASPLARPNRPPCALFTIRPWTAVLLNEGSSTRVYKTYEYFHKRPPSLLGALLGAEPFPNDAALVPPSVRALGYVGIFPLSSHVDTLVRALPRVDRLFVQLVPRNDILNDKAEMAHLDMDDLWSERNASYGKIIPKMFDDSDAAGNWRHLVEFESGDAADREAWEMAVAYVEASSDWRVEREGVFVRRRGQKQQQ